MIFQDIWENIKDNLWKINEYIVNFLLILKINLI